MNQPRSTHVFKNKLTIKAGILLSQRAGFDSVCTGWEVYIEAGGAGRSPWCRPLLSTGDTDLRAMESQCWDHSQVWVPGRSDQASVVTEGSARASERGVKVPQAQMEEIFRGKTDKMWDLGGERESRMTQ